jgi:hypothetical protein
MLVFLLFFANMRKRPTSPKYGFMFETPGNFIFLDSVRAIVIIYMMYIIYRISLYLGGRVVQVLFNQDAPPPPPPPPPIRVYKQ